MPGPMPRRIVMTTPDKDTLGTEEGILVQVQVLTIDAVAKALRTGKPVPVNFTIAVTGEKP